MNKILGFVQSVFSFINGLVNILDNSAINTVSAFVPWIAPLPTAYMSYMNLSSKLNFPSWVAVPTAIIIDMMGMAIVSTSITFYKHNQRYKSDEKKQPVMLVIGMLFYYLFIVLTINVLGEIPVSKDYDIVVRIIQIFLICTLSIPAMVLLGVRASFMNLMKEISEIKAEKKEELRKAKELEMETYRKLPESVSSSSESNRQVTGNVSEISGLSDKTWDSVPAEIKRKIATMSTKEVMEYYGKSERTARNWVTYAKEFVKEN